MNELDICPKCEQSTWNINVYVHMTAPGRFYGSLSKRNIYSKYIKIEAALWETTSWWCSNPKCMYTIDGVKQVRLVKK
jgi:hypothetical protein